MSVSLTINGHTLEASPGPSLFDFAEQFGMQVPTSCNKQGKCKECVLEIVEGQEHLTPPTKFEEHLKGKFRLACQCHVSSAAELISASPHIKCHTMRRGNMRIERHALGLPTSNEKMPLDPCVTRDGDRILLDG